MKILEFILDVALGFSVGYGVCTSLLNDEWEQRIVEAELAEFVVDSTTGDTTFIIYAEQPTED